jgi:hypothetical protein
MVIGYMIVAALLMIYIVLMPVWCYYRGTLRSSPIPAAPKFITNILSPSPAPSLGPVPPPHPCQFCGSTAGFNLAGDKWECKVRTCRRSVPINPPTLRS